MDPSSRSILGVISDSSVFRGCSAFLKRLMLYLVLQPENSIRLVFRLHSCVCNTYSILSFHFLAGDGRGSSGWLPFRGQGKFRRSFFGGHLTDIGGSFLKSDFMDMS
jgi:hypothetical protein